MVTQGSRVSGSGKTTVSLDFASDNGIVLGLTSMQNRAHINFLSYMQNQSVKIEQYMKDHHPWTNRTGRAERGLHTTVENVQTGGLSEVRIGLYHSSVVWPWYGIHLEYSMGRRFAIIEPTQKYYGPRLLNELNLFELYRFTKNPVK